MWIFWQRLWINLQNKMINHADFESRGWSTWSVYVGICNEFWEVLVCWVHLELISRLDARSASSKTLRQKYRRTTLWYWWNSCCISAHFENISLALLDPFSKGSRVGLGLSRSALTWFHHSAVASAEPKNLVKGSRLATRAVPIPSIDIFRVSAVDFRS